ncbi:hypothetical protein NPIL_406971, partial [Nephila pilipes]
VSLDIESGTASDRNIASVVSNYLISSAEETGTLGDKDVFSDISKIFLDQAIDTEFKKDVIYYSVKKLIYEALHKIYMTSKDQGTNTQSFNDFVFERAKEILNKRHIVTSDKVTSTQSDKDVDSDDLIESSDSETSTQSDKGVTLESLKEYLDQETSTQYFKDFFSPLVKDVLKKRIISKELNSENNVDEDSDISSEDSGDFFEVLSSEDESAEKDSNASINSKNDYNQETKEQEDLAYKTMISLYSFLQKHVN